MSNLESFPDITNRTYQEVLTPSPAVWVITIGISTFTGLIVVQVTGPGGAIAVSLGSALLSAVALWRSSAQIQIANGVLFAGRAHIPITELGAVVVLDREQMQALRGPQADGRAYLCQRPWITGGILIEIPDPTDPVPYWLISSRAPKKLTAALAPA